MDHVPEDDILQTSIYITKMLGEYFDYSSTRLTMFRLWNCFVFSLNIIVSLNSLFYIKTEMYVKTLEGATTASHTLVNYLCFLYYKPDIEQLFHDLKQFWDYKNIPTSRLYNNIKNIHKKAKATQKLIYTSTSIVMITFCLRPVLNSSSKFIFYCVIPFDSIRLETLILFAQYYFIIIIVPVIFAADSLYLSFSVHIISQLRLLNYKLERMRLDSSDEELYECVRHHQLMISIYGRMKRIFFWMLLFHYFVTLGSGCCQLYMILAGNLDTMDLLTNIMYIAALLIQFGYYAFPVEEIVTEFNSISNSIYMSSWLKRSINQKKLLLFIMVRAQQQEYMSIGGIMDMNVDAFGSVIRKMFSFCAVLRNILNK